MSKLRDLLLNNIEELETELDEAFNEGGTQERVILEELFGLNGETVDAFGNATIEDVARHYKQAVGFYISNKPSVDKVASALTELPASSLSSYPSTACDTAVSQPDGFATDDQEWGEYTENDFEPETSDEDEVIFAVIF